MCLKHNNVCIYSCPISCFFCFIISASLRGTSEPARSRGAPAPVPVRRRRGAGAAAAERRTIDRFAAALFTGQQGKVVKGVVAGVTGAGAFVSLGDGAADGFLPARTLPDDYYTLDKSGMRMVGRHNGMALGIGDAVDVLVVDVTPVNGGILLSYVDGGGTAKCSGRGKPRKAKAGAGKAKRGAKAKARGKTGARGGKKLGKTRRSR